MLEQLDNSNISKHLGKSSEYKAQYDKSVLVREPRQSNRTYLNIQDESVPFVGQDTWNNYEVTALTYGGVPVVGVAKVVYPCNNSFIVESKSFKLYFNTFNMTKMGKDAAEVRANIASTAAKDLSELLETNVQCHVSDNSQVSVFEDTVASRKDAWHVFNGVEARTLEDVVDVSKLQFNTYTETPGLLTSTDTQGNYFYHSGLLRSRCKVTFQPDSGDVYIYLKGAKAPTEESLLEYICSYREECHFHEEICEALYKRLLDIFQPEELFVRCLYARRGSCDILVDRATHEHLLSADLRDVTRPHIKTPRQ